MAFNSVKLTGPNGLPDINFDANPQGGVTISVGPGYRFLTINPGGGHWETRSLGSVPNDQHMELDVDNSHVSIPQI